MRFQRLQVPAFGPFTNLDLRFSDQPRDLQVVHGPNEAGKSSLLRTIRALLFGIDSQSPDRFLHEYGSLQIRGEILNRAGRRLEFCRRKGSKNTLLDAQESPLADSALEPFLGSVDEEYFSAMFGLGAQELRAGAQQLMQGKGKMGEALFNASLGGTPVQKVLEALQGEAAKLFKGNTRVGVSIRPTATQYKELLRQSRDAILQPEAWEGLGNEIAQKQAERAEVERTLAGLQEQLGWIARCEDALPSVGRLGEAQRQLQLLSPAPDLAADFIPRARAARLAAGEAKAKVADLSLRIMHLETQRAACPVSPAFVAEAGGLDAIHQERSAHRTYKESLANLETRLAGIEPVLRAGMKRLELTGDLDSLEARRVTSANWLACQEAADAVRQAASRRDDNTQRAAELEQKIKEAQANLNAVPDLDLTPLREALATAAEATNADRSLAATASSVTTLTREVKDRHGLVLGAPFDWDAAAALAVPGPATIRRFRDELASLRRDILRHATELREQEAAVQAVQEDLDRIERRGQLPSEEALRAARLHRDKGWELVLAEWKGDGAKEALTEGLPLEAAYPEAVRKVTSSPTGCGRRRKRSRRPSRSAS